MDQLNVGEAGCEYETIVSTLRDSAGASQLLRLLDDIGRSLGISSVDCERNTKLSLLKLESPWSLLRAYLEYWNQKEGANAKLTKLIEILKNHNLNNSAHMLEKKFLDSSPGSSAVGYELIATIEKDSPPVGITNLWDISPWVHRLISVDVVHPNAREFVAFENSDALLLPQDPPKGNACIINILEYLEPKKLNRDGAIVDSHNMKNLWRKLGYNVTVHDGENGSLTEKQVSKHLDDFKTQCIQDKVSSMVVFIGSHGMKGDIQTADGNLMNINEKIVGKMTMCTGDETLKKEWAKVIKIFIIQACRNDPFDTAVDHDPNAIVCYATSLGVKAHRYEAYVKHLAEVLMQNSYKMDFVKMLDEVGKRVYESTKNTCVVQRPAYDILKGFKTFYFNLKPT